MWNPEFWLPRNVTWDQLPTHSEDLVYPIMLTFPILGLRILFESFVGIPCGFYLGYGTGTLTEQIKRHLFFGFASNTRSKRILECFFRFSSYLFLFLFGCITLADAPWLRDVTLCWIGYPFHEVSNAVWWYYMIEMGFYYSLLITSLFDVRRTDFRQLLFHHFVTILLLSLSWMINFIRVGTLILILHDVSDISLELAKLVHYDEANAKYANAIFFIFLISWTLTRIGYFPLVVIRSAIFDAPTLIQSDYDLFNPFEIPYAPRIIIGFLFCLLALHIFWTTIIVRIVIRTITVGEAKDVRSDDESEDEKENVDGVYSRNTQKEK
uniref:TLC domain-containing protein n=1 Tax=Parascaris univalens TaxID=6257 RepID=A0A914ZUF9_PARUN